MRHELNKMLLHRKGFGLILLYFAFSFFFLFFLDTPVSPDIEQNRQAYAHYLSQVEGKCTADTERFLSEEAVSIANANSTLQKIYGEYYDGTLSKEEFLAQSAKAEEIIRYESGFNLIYEQFSDIRENAENRYFLYTNGWNGLLANDNLNLPMVVLLLLLITPVLCYEYENGMDNLIRTVQGTSRYALSKISAVLLTVTLICLLDTGMRLAFFQLKYGLPHGEYPLQSLSYFASFAGTETLWSTFLKISAYRLFGSLSFAALILFVSAIVKKYALTLFACTAGMLLPYFGLTKASSKYFLPGPLGWMTAAGYFRGSEYSTDSLTNEKIVVFQQIPDFMRNILFAATLILAIILLAAVVKRHMNIWCFGKKLKRIPTFSLLVVICITVSSFCGCALSQNPDYPILNLAQKNIYENDKYRFEATREDSGKVVISCENKTTGAIQPLVRNPMQALVELSENLYGYGDFVYYMQSDNDKSQFFSTLSRFSVVEVDTRDFSERIVYEQNLNSTQGTFMGIGQTKTDYQAFFMAQAQAFFADEKSIYFFTDNQVYQINRATGKRQIIIENAGGRNLAFDGEKIYFTNQKSQVIVYDIPTQKQDVLPDVVTESFWLTKDKLIFLNRREQNRIYSMNLADGQMERITEEPALSFSVEGDMILYTDKVDLKEHTIALPSDA